MTCVSSGVSSGTAGDGSAGKVELLFPTLDGDETAAGGLLSNWFVPDGAHVTIGELLATVEGMRVVGDVTAPVSGVLRQVVAAGAKVGKGVIIGVVEED